VQLVPETHEHDRSAHQVLEVEIDLSSTDLWLALKIVALTNYLSARGGGIPPAIFPLYELLARKGVNIVLAGGDPPDRPIEVRVLTYRTLGPKSFAFSSDLLKILDQERPDLVHLHGLWTYGSIAAQIWGRRTGNPVVVSTHGMVDQWALGHSALKKWLAGAAFEWANLRNASCIHALTDGEVRDLKRLGFHDRVIRIPNGIDLAKSVNCNEPSRRILLYLGRLHPKKGVSETLIAWSIFQKNLSIDPARWLLVIAGWDDGGYLRELYDITMKYDLQEHVKFMGPVFGSTKDALYASADAAILASYSEGLPMSVLEAWSFGKPVFITEQCNLPEGFQSGAAFKITTDPQDIAKTLIGVLPNRAHLISAGRAARTLAERSFDWAKISETWLSLYSSLLHLR
jgi:glycosyltransferase involved in cell wall biosynthesis